MSSFGKQWTSDARSAMARQPNYFVWWYTAKSVGLVAAIATAAYFAGKARGVGVGVGVGRRGDRDQGAA